MVKIDFTPTPTTAKETTSIDFKPSGAGVKADAGFFESIGQKKESRKLPTGLEKWLEEKLPGYARTEAAGGIKASRVAGEVLDMGSGLVQAIPQLLDVVLPKLVPAKKGETKKEYTQRLMQVEDASQQGRFDLLRGIVKESVISTLATLSNPAQALQDRPVEAMLDIVGVATLAKGVKGVAGDISKAVGKAAKNVSAKGLSLTTPLSEDDILRAIDDPILYTSKPWTSNELATRVQPIKDKVMKNFEDITDFKYKTIEDTVANRVGQFKENKISSSNIKRAVSSYVAEKNASAITKLDPSDIKELNKIYKEIDSKAFKSYNDLTGKYSNVIAFEDAHKIKQNIYKVMKGSYNNPKWTDDVGNGYKVAANKINEQLRDISTEYAKANDEVQAIYKINETFGKQGVEKFAEGSGTSKRFNNLYNDPDGKRLLDGIESVLPENQRFLPQLEEINDVQRIRGSFKASKGEGLATTLITGGLSGAGYKAAGIPGALAGGYTGLSLTQPRIAAANLRSLQRLGKFGKRAAPAGKAFDAAASKLPSLLRR